MSDHMFQFATMAAQNSRRVLQQLELPSGPSEQHNGEQCFSNISSGAPSLNKGESLLQVERLHWRPAGCSSAQSMPKVLAKGSPEWVVRDATLTAHTGT